jgi:hypothetical protein
MAENEEMKLALLLTATVEVAVKGGNFTTKERMEMYTSTLRYYAKTLGRSVPIYVVENSNADLTPWTEEFEDSLDLTVFQFRPDNPALYEGFDPSRGKGYNEYLMIKKGLVLMANTPPHQSVTHFLKITGRYPMLNVRQIINEVSRRGLHRDIVYMGDIKDTKLYELIGMDTLSSHWGDSRFFMARRDFYAREMIDCYQEMNDYAEGMWAEHYFLNLSRRYRHDSRFIFRFRTQVQFGGIGGTCSSSQIGGSSGYDSRRNRVKAGVRQVMRILFPYIWF